MDVRIYIADVGALEDPVLFAALYQQVSPQRRAKVDRLRFPKDQRLSLGAGVVLQRALTDLGIRQYTLSEAGQGKPCLADRNDVYFNLSHAGTKVLGVTADRDVGCDTEPVQSADLALAERFFHPEEYRSLLFAGDERDALFCRYWTLKESFVKATGLGLTLPLSAFQIVLGETVTVRQNVDDRQYHFYELSQDGDRFAVCLADRPLLRPSIETIHFQA